MNRYEGIYRFRRTTCAESILRWIMPATMQTGHSTNQMTEGENTL